MTNGAGDAGDGGGIGVSGGNVGAGASGDGGSGGGEGGGEGHCRRGWLDHRRWSDDHPLPSHTMKG